MALRIATSTKVIALAAAVLTAVAIGMAVASSLDPHQYFYYRPEDRSRWTYDSASVLLACLFMLVAATIATAALIAPWPRLLALRCTLALLLLVPWGMFSTQFVLHAPGYVFIHHLWLLFIILVVLLAGLGSLVRYVALAIRGRSGNAI